MKKQLICGMLALMFILQAAGCKKGDIKENTGETTISTSEDVPETANVPSNNSENPVESEKSSIGEQVKITKDSDMYEAKELENVELEYSEAERKHILDTMEIDTFNDTFEVVDKIWNTDGISGLSLIVKNKLDRPVYLGAIIEGYKGDKVVGSNTNNTYSGLFIDAGQTLPIVIGGLDLHTDGKPDKIKVQLLRVIDYINSYNGGKEDYYTITEGELTSKETKSGKTKTSCSVDLSFDNDKIVGTDFSIYMCAAFKKNGKIVDIDSNVVSTHKDKSTEKFSTYFDVDDYEVYISIVNYNDGDIEKATKYNNEDYKMIKEKFGLIEDGKEYFSPDGRVKLTLCDRYKDKYENTCSYVVENIGDSVVDVRVNLTFGASTINPKRSDHGLIDVIGLRPGDKYYSANILCDEYDKVPEEVCDEVIVTAITTNLFGYNRDDKVYNNIVAIPNEIKEIEYVERLSDEYSDVYRLKNFSEKYWYDIHEIKKKDGKIVDTIDHAERIIAGEPRTDKFIKVSKGNKVEIYGKLK